MNSNHPKTVRHDEFFIGLSLYNDAKINVTKLESKQCNECHMYIAS